MPQKVTWTPLRKFFRPPAAVESPPVAGVVEIQARLVPVLFRRHPRARRYLLRLRADKTVLVTMPRRGSLEFARQFVASRRGWLEKQWRNLEARRTPPPVLRPGMEALLRGRRVALEARERDGLLEIWLDNQQVPAAAPTENLRPAVEEYMRALARRELALRAEELARLHGAPMRRVIVRNQKSRWGSCSVRGTISLNWRLIQVPEAVRDYIILHELTHLRHLNHSPRFWAAVEEVCPDYRAAEDWLKVYSAEVGI
jgi:predicted metal-dependent hydrolase